MITKILAVLFALTALGKPATALAQAETFKFDMSDLAPTAFGSDAEFSLLQEWFRNPSDIDGITQKLEAAAAKAYGS